MGPLVNGSTEEESYGSVVTNIIHGAISDDGKWLTSLTFSRQTIWKSANYGVSFRVTLKNITLSTNSGEVTFGYLGRGSDVHKFVDDIQYYNGPLVNGQIGPDNSYVSTDWNNTDLDKIPILLVAFETAEQNQSTGSGSGGGRM